MASDAVTGKVRDKLGIERGAAKGLVGKGLMLGRGLVGAAVKKGEGVAAELSVGPPSLREEGVKKEEGRLRLPRMLHGEAREVRAFDPTTALGWSCLQAVANSVSRSLSTRASKFSRISCLLRPFTACLRDASRASSIFSCA